MATEHQLRSNLQQEYLFHILKSEMLPVEEVQKIHDETRDDFDTNFSLDDTIRALNKTLKNSLSVQVAKIESGGTWFYGIAHDGNSPDSIDTYGYSDVKINKAKAYMRLLLKEIIQSETRSLSKAAAHKLQADKALNNDFTGNQVDAEACITQLLERDVIMLTKTNEIIIGPRAYLELKSLLLEFGMDSKEIPEAQVL